SVAPTARCNSRPPAFGKTSVLVTGRAAHIQASGIRKSNEQQQRELHTSRSGADRRRDRISSRAAEAELDPRCPAITDRRPKPHSSEPGARPRARGGPGDKTFAPSATVFLSRLRPKAGVGFGYCLCPIDQLKAWIAT